jgi:hypothetical protein
MGWIWADVLKIMCMRRMKLEGGFKSGKKKRIQFYELCDIIHTLNFIMQTGLSVLNINSAITYIMRHNILKKVFGRGVNG